MVVKTIAQSFLGRLSYYHLVMGLHKSNTSMFFKKGNELANCTISLSVSLHCSDNSLTQFDLFQKTSMNNCSTEVLIKFIFLLFRPLGNAFKAVCLFLIKFLVLIKVVLAKSELTHLAYSKVINAVLCFTSPLVA